jgi:hypothetical protein
MTAKDFLPHFDTDIIYSDFRSVPMPEVNVTVRLIGVGLDYVIVRRNNLLTTTLPLNHSKIIFDLPTIVQSERILCAAIHYEELPLLRKGIPNTHIYPKNITNGLVFCGFRHPHCMYSMVAITGKRSCEAGEHAQGFLTNFNRFVNREEGLKIALAANQVIDLKNVRGNNLYSEDLY